MRKHVSKKHKILAMLVLLIIAALLQGYHMVTQPIVLEFGIFAGSYWDVPIQDSNKFFDEAISEFEKMNPGIKVIYRSGTLKRNYSEWLSQKIIRGKEPDIFCILPKDFNTLVSIGILKDLDGLIDHDPQFDSSKMYVNAIQSGRFQKRQYALPSEIAPVLMFVNKTLLAREGIPIPKGNWTWNDFYEICKKVTRDTDGDGQVDQFGTFGFTWQEAVYTNGQRLFEPDGSGAYFDSPGVVEAVEFLMKLDALHLNAKVTSNDFDAGKVAFRPFLFSTYKAYKPYPYRVKKYGQFEWECINLPRGPKGNNVAELHSLLMGISSRTKYEKEAWEFLKFLVYKENTQTNVLKYSYGIPVLRYITESEFGERVFSAVSPEETFINKSLLSEVIEQSIVTPKFQKYEDAVTMADKEIYQAISMEKDAGKSMGDLNKEINEFLKNK
ncbi:carbohydrate ABC transporter substrate-binding protein, CUT1 family [Pelosinus propionicus DSM 13327]|uniref:Carbohydrate ABC transporter substrate-binding protein, CUT1 family n=2 Tax=Pelosinus TaxID=365348 RepID=A0A1I4PJU5_9FIRM|nr:carbohydrate ABC transporter substrate-binding protein, CUT1 family [Pelosinus propionicus DSM 13327]